MRCSSACWMRSATAPSARTNRSGIAHSSTVCSAQTPILLMADFADYAATQSRVDTLYRDTAAWNAAAMRNIAGMGFSRPIAPCASTRSRVGRPLQTPHAPGRASRRDLTEPTHAGERRYRSAARRRATRTRSARSACMRTTPANSGYARCCRARSTVEVLDAVSGKALTNLSQYANDGFFEARIPLRRNHFDYRLRIRWHTGEKAFTPTPTLSGHSLRTTI